jgi:hypothetical protein
VAQGHDTRRPQKDRGGDPTARLRDRALYSDRTVTAYRKNLSGVINAPALMMWNVEKT